jgi:LysR family transcriptional activator of nhaA
LEEWFEKLDIRPLIMGEFQDSALLEVFGQAGRGIFMAPSVVEREVARQYRVRVIGRTNQLRERFYAISVERRLKHPAVVAISEGAGAVAVDGGTHRGDNLAWQRFRRRR